MNPFARFAAVFVLTTSLLVVCAGPLLAIDYYVNGTNGNDANSGLSADNAWKTITHAVSSAEATVSALAIIHIAEGTYSASMNGETFPIDVKSYTTLQGADKEATVLDAEYLALHVILCRYREGVQLRSLSIVGGAHAPCQDGVEDGGGGVICHYSSLTIEDCVIAGNYASSSSGHAGGILCTNCDLTIVSCVISDNEAMVCPYPYSGFGTGGIRCQNSTVEIMSSEIQRNTYGGIFTRGSSLWIEDSRICDNRWGDAINANDCTLISCDISRNRHGKPICAKVFMSKCLIQDNWFNDSGGIAPCDGSVIEDCAFVGNFGQGSTDIIWTWDSALRFTRCIFESNDCDSGSLVAIWSHYRSVKDEVIFEDCLFDGGGIETPPSYVLYLSGGPVWDHEEVEDYEAPAITVKGCTFTGNVNVFTNRIKGETWELDISDCAISGNRGQLFGTRSDDPLLPEDYCTIRNSCLQEEFDGEGNFVADPMFASGPLGDYYLSSVEAGQEADSPCIDAGSTSASIAGVSNLTTRTDGAFDTGIVDIGYHYSATPATIDCHTSSAGEPLAPGDTLSASISIENAGLPLWVDVYAGFILPDGSIYCITPDGFTPDLVPWAPTSHLPTDFASPHIAVFHGLVPGGLPEGTYTFAAALSLTGAFRPIGDIAFASFAVSR